MKGTADRQGALVDRILSWWVAPILERLKDGLPENNNDDD